MVLWESVVICGGIVAALLGPYRGRAVIETVGAAVFFTPHAFLFGVLTGFAWAIGAYMLRQCWRLLCRVVRVRSGPIDCPCCIRAMA